MLGTPNYISPEQALGQPATGASDLYALGVVGHEMLTGIRPFDRGTPIATAISHVNEPPPPLADEVPPELRAVVASLLEKKPEDRPANARAVAEMMGIATTELAGLAEGLAALVNWRLGRRHRDPRARRAHGRRAGARPARLTLEAT